MVSERDGGREVRGGHAGLAAEATVSGITVVFHEGGSEAGRCGVWLPCRAG